MSYVDVHTYVHTYIKCLLTHVGTLRICIYPPDNASSPLVFSLHAISAVTIVTDTTKLTTATTTVKIAPMIAQDTGLKEPV